FFLQASDDFRYGVRLDRNQEGSFADRIQRVHAEDLRDFRDSRIDTDPREIDLDSESRGLRHLPDRVSHAALGRVAHRPPTSTSESDGGRDRKSTRLNSSHV